MQQSGDISKCNSLVIYEETVTEATCKDFKRTVAECVVKQKMITSIITFQGSVI